MKNVQRKLLAAFAAVILFSSAAFADGDMGGGGLAEDTTVVVKHTDQAPEGGDMGGGGLAENINWLLLTGRIIGLIG